MQASGGTMGQRKAKAALQRMLCAIVPGVRLERTLSHMQIHEEETATSGLVVECQSNSEIARQQGSHDSDQSWEAPSALFRPSAFPNARLASKPDLQTEGAMQNYLGPRS